MGFHATSMAKTSQTLQKNRNILANHVQIVRAEDIAHLANAVRTYATSGDPVDLGFVQYEGVICTKAWTADVILISAADLAGPMPGPRSTASYAAVPALAAALYEAWDEALPGADIVFAFTTCAPQSWLTRVYAHHLRTSRMTMNSARFQHEYAAAADMQSVAMAVQGAVPDAEVATIRLEQFSQTQLGPIGPLLDLAEVPRQVQDRLDPGSQVKTHLDRRQREQFLLLNRSGLSDAEVISRKHKALK
ncbi:MAG: hypothetical protein AAF601_16350 [Pseudomonadota bacterium]